MSFFLLVGAFAVAVGLTRGAIFYALANSMVDVPGQRSSHANPTPRGGGIGIIAVLAIYLLFPQAITNISPPITWALLGAVLAVAAVGWWDDHRSLPPSVRALVHIAAASGATICLGGYSALQIGSVQLDLGLWGVLLAVIGVAWMINLYNFMDGVDGLAGMQAVLTGVAAGTLCWWDGHPEFAMIAFIVAAASAGFLVWNWPPAKIFMGDVGSGALGATFGVLAVATETAGSLSVFIWLLLLSVFIVDASCTLAARLLRGEKWYTAHRSHAYQLLVSAGWSHRRVTQSAVYINVLIVWPLTYLAWVQPHMAFWFGASVFAALSALWLVIQHRFGGGRAVVKRM